MWQVKGGSAVALATSTELSTAASLYQDTLASIPASVRLNINNTATWNRVNFTLSAAIEQLKGMSPDLAQGGKPLTAGVVPAADLVCPSRERRCRCNRRRQRIHRLAQASWRLHPTPPPPACPLLLPLQRPAST